MGPESISINLSISKRKVKIVLAVVVGVFVAATLLYAMSPAKWERAVVKAVKQAAIDPGSVDVEFLCYTKGFVGSPTLYEKTPAVCALVNAKNKVGGYVGKKLTVFALNPDNGEAEFVIKEVDPTFMCERICQYQAWSSRNAGEELARYSKN